VTVTAVLGSDEKAQPEMVVMPSTACTLGGFSRMAWIAARVGVVVSRTVLSVKQYNPICFMCSSCVTSFVAKRGRLRGARV
jgi:hypothetical protein